MSSNSEALADILHRWSVWMKGHEIPGYDRNVWRRDDFGNIIRFADYGKRESPYGWEKDHVQPQALLGQSHLGNLRPLHCSKNASLGGSLGNLLGRIRA